MKNVIIAEKPSLAMNIVKAIGKMDKHDGYFENDKYIVTFAFGHLFALCDIDDYLGHHNKWQDVKLPYVPDKFEWKLKDDAGVKKQYKIIEKLVLRNDVDTVINCGDSDREGEVIANNIINRIFKDNNISKTVKRLWLPEQTAETIRNQLNNCKPISETANLMREGIARTYIDWLYGINLTRYLTLQTGTLFPVGRVLVPVVEYIYSRDMEIKNFVPKKYLVIDTTITKDGEEVKLNFKDFKFDDNSDATRNIAENILNRVNGKNIKVVSVENKEVKKNRPKLFSLDTLQNFMFKKYKMSIADTLKYTQSLYEKGFVTYPRTNTEYLAENEKNRIRSVINKLNVNNVSFRDGKAIFDDSKVESHSALTPTTSVPSLLSDKESLVYNAIKNRFCSVFATNDTILNQTKVTFKINDTDYTTSLTGNSVKQAGFLEFEKSEEHILPSFREQEEFVPKFALVTNETKPPKKITEADLNNYLKNPYKSEKEDVNLSDDDLYKNILDGLEIGTVATRSGIIENAVKYGYIEKSKNVLSITDKGCKLIEDLKALHIDMFKDKTVEISKKLKEIYKNTYEVEDLVNLIKTELVSYINQDTKVESFKSEKSEKEVIGVCPKCGKNVLENDKSFYCKDYKNCNFFIWKKNKFFDAIGLKHFTKANMKDCLTKGYFEAKNLTSKTGKKYNAKLYMQIGDKYTNFEMKFD